ncbi:hypothetical protein JAAARDRAFT_143236, partial [Jaapia argillacea MUCL 33604]
QLIKGCEVHWKRSLMRIKELIEESRLPLFTFLISVLEGRNTEPEQFLQAADQIHTGFPKVKGWLSWWLNPLNGAMIFPAIHSMPAELHSRLPDSTNGGESNHWLLYRACGQKHSLLEGIRRLFLYVREIETLYKNVRSELHLPSPFSYETNETFVTRWRRAMQSERR